MDTRLTTIDGFPRSDIDVATSTLNTCTMNRLTGPVRTTRARITHLRNDYKALMAKVEVALYEQFAALEAQDETNTPAAADRPAPADIPFDTAQKE
jgi:26S proteasome regulatory subunit N4